MCNFDCRNPDSCSICCLCTIDECGNRKCKHAGDIVACQEEIAYEQVIDGMYKEDENE